MVVNERFAMLADVRLGIMRVRSINEELPNGGLFLTVLLRQWSNVLFFGVMVVIVAEPINNGPWGAIAMLATCIIVLQKFDVIRDGRVARGVRHWCCTTIRKQGTMIADAGLQLCHCGKGKIECQTLVINITTINKLIKTQL
jgi:hypothetical protein